MESSEKEVRFTNRITSQQLDPYERKRRIAAKQQERLQMGTVPQGAAIIRSKKESRMQLEMERNLNPGAYIDASARQFEVEQATKRGIGFSKNDPLFMRAAEVSEEGHHRFSNNLTRYLSKLRFNWLKEGFMRMMNNQKLKGRVRIAYYVVPVTFSIAIASANYLQQSFLVYLKYQAMVDSFSKRSNTQ
jgi:hypothetical protein